ncbi:hypothetical protein GUJ93_ZPchr0458g22703 [Zizania palustris]|uniref:GTP cyclohydrolase 1 n=1 Tax=Zizania palustris TaxID=103762 RepID=A0A8J5UZV0_ZIZPA|nr:hypothetical protein GUJ93_ZPchr0458g22703 [Zizania palustris]
MGALEEAHPATAAAAAAIVAACECYEEEEEEHDILEVGCGDGEAPADAMEPAVRALLLGLGEDARREGLRRTPKRVAKAFRDGTRGYRQKVKDIVQGALFPEVGVDKRTGSAGGTGGQVVVRDIDLFSYCESCLLPFSVQCHVGYVPSGGRVVGLSKLSRVADVFAKRLQNPQRLANEVCTALHGSIQPAGVAVALQCWHIPLPENLKCKSMQGWISTSHSSCSGVFEGENSSFWNDFSALLKLRGIDMERDNHSASLSWCPLRSHEGPRLQWAPQEGHNRWCDFTQIHTSSL